MHKILASTLFLSTALLPAQTVANGQGAVLLAKNSEPAVVASDVPAAHARRVSTGVTAPKLISGPAVRVAISDFPSQNLSFQHVVVSFKVDEKGVPQNVHLVKSINQTVDARILAAVRDYRFEPATLDDQVVAMDVNLNVNFEAR
ncbi:MAG TPA: TonB family protein [Terracidiphilus sp.]|nr:TonB family protein [Terracidiphilus sp.]